MANGPAVKNRDEKGRFVAGCAGGPGRPPSAFSITELLRSEIMSRPHVVKRWVDLMESEDERVALMAMTAAANRVEGMPNQKIEQEITSTEKWEQVQQTGTQRLRRVK